MVQVLLVSLVVAHPTDMSSAVFKNIHSCTLACSLHRIGVAIGTIRDSLIVHSQICNLWEQALLRAQGELLVRHHGVMRTDSHHTMLLILDASLALNLRLSWYLRDRYLAVRKHLTIICTR